MTEKRNTVKIEFDIVEKEDGSVMVDLGAGTVKDHALEARLLSATLMASDMLGFVNNTGDENIRETFRKLGAYLQKLESDYVMRDAIKDINSGMFGKDGGGEGL